jgi:5-methylcytosine-specific restriction endonuclease McrA
MKPKWIDKLQTVVKTSKCRSDVLRALGLSTDGSGNHRVVKRWIDKLNISTSHFNYRNVISQKNGKLRRCKVYLPCEFLIENWHGSISPIKSWFRKNSLYECQICKNHGEHCGLPLSLQLDHINGNSSDNRKENLRWLCPNCHSQSMTYGGKKLHLHRKKKSEINPNWNKEPKLKQRKVERPEKEILEKEILEIPMETIGKKYGVSGNAIKKWCISYKILLPKYGRGYWTKKSTYGGSGVKETL